MLYHNRKFHLETKNIDDFENKTQCFMCDKELSNKHTFWGHVEIPHDFGCDTCKRSFVFNKELIYHKHKVHLGMENIDEFEDKAQCFMCDRKLSDKNNFWRHVEVPHNHSCDSCEKSFVNQIEILSHSYLTHNGKGDVLFLNGKVHCPMCDREFSEQHSAWQHISLPHPFCCDSCEKSYTLMGGESGLITHTVQVHQGKANLNLMKSQTTCDKCDFELADEVTYRKHLLLPHNFACEACDKTFTRKGGDNGVISHIMANHNGTAKFREEERNDTRLKFDCESCGKSSTTKADLKKHMEKYHGVQKTFTCKSCGNQFNSSEKLKLHTQNFHDIDKKVKCFSCDKYFTNKSGRDKHYRIKHMNESIQEGSIKCEMCPEKFSNDNDLKRHISSIHSGKPFKCQECQLEFTLRSSLDQHLSSFHIGQERTFNCDKCDKVFKHKHNLDIHLNTIHLGQRKIVNCTQCDKVFSSKGNLSRHVASSHLGQPTKASKSNTHSGIEDGSMMEVDETLDDKDDVIEDSDSEMEIDDDELPEVYKAIAMKRDCFVKLEKLDLPSNCIPK